MPSSMPIAFAALVGGGIVLEYGVRTFRGAQAGVSSSSSTSSTPSTPSGSATPSGHTTVTDSSSGKDQTAWAHDLLTSLGAPLTAANVHSILQWEAAEGGNWSNTAKYNPLNTTLVLGGSTNMGGSTAGVAGVQAYSSWDEGLQATVNTLQGSGYSDIVSALQSGKGLGDGTMAGLRLWVSGSSTGTGYNFS